MDSDPCILLHDINPINLNTAQFAKFNQHLTYLKGFANSHPIIASLGARAESKEITEELYTFVANDLSKNTGKRKSKQFDFSKT